jgi:hypothetical protein
MALSLVETFSGKEGVRIWGYDEGRDGLVEVAISPDNINGYYENYVRLTTNLPQDDMQKLISSMRMVQDGLISKRTWRTRFAGMTLPSDEEQRIRVEMVLASDELKQLGMDSVMTNYFGADWKKQLGMEPPQPEQPQGPPPGMMPPPQGGPPMMPPGMMPPPGMLPPGPPPTMQPPTMMPGGMAGMPALPPEIQGQMTPEGLGLPPEPALFDAMMGGQPPQGITDEQLQRIAAGLPA